MGRIVAPVLPPPPIPGDVREVTPELRDGDDPRPDLAGDRARWGYLLDRARELDEQEVRDSSTGADSGLYQRLYRLRQLGARIVAVGDDWDLKPDGRLPDWRLMPGEIAPEQWAQIRADWLVPHTAALKQLLAAPQVSQHPG